MSREYFELNGQTVFPVYDVSDPQPITNVRYVSYARRQDGGYDIVRIGDLEFGDKEP